MLNERTNKQTYKQTLVITIPPSGNTHKELMAKGDVVYTGLDTELRVVLVSVSTSNSLIALVLILLLLLLCYAAGPRLV